MNRSLLIPAICCAFGFVALLAILHQAAGREAATDSAGQIARSSRVDSETLRPAPAYLPSASAAAKRSEDSLLMSANDAERKLTALSGEYLRPWRKWETSPNRLYSRAAARPIPSIAAEVAMSPSDTGAGDAFLLATIVVRTGKQSQSVPCVVDRTSKQVCLFSDGQWLREDEWLKKAPRP
jgi:hypothetical protein